jgi:hypothetical protein
LEPEVVDARFKIVFDVIRKLMAPAISKGRTVGFPRLRYRIGCERGEPATPGVPMQVTLTLYALRGDQPG